MLLHYTQTYGTNQGERDKVRRSATIVLNLLLQYEHQPVDATDIEEEKLLAAVANLET
jgi:hypothetical protein